MVAASSGTKLADFQDIELGGHDLKVNTLDWNCTGDCLASGTPNPALLLHRLQPSGLGRADGLSAAPSQKLSGVATNNFFVVWHPTDPDRLASLDDQGVRIWDARHAKVTMTLPLHNPKKLLYAVWVPNGHDILVTSASNINTLIDVRKEAVIKALPNDIETNQAAISPDGKTVMQGLGNGHVSVCDFPNFRPRTSLPAHMERVVSCKFDPSGSYFLSGSHDSTVTVWDVHNLMPVTTHHNYDAAINDASFSHDSQLLALGGEEQVIKINETMTGELAHEIPCRSLPLALCWNPQHMMLAYSGRDHGTSAYVNVFAP
ncbi:hypothetical protein ABBQ32_002542 [Trebouxia sp. C0010 RCD-2024]